MVCSGCGSVARAAAGDGSWIARETLTGRMSTLPGRRKALLAAGAVVAAGGLFTAVSFLASADRGELGGGRPDAAGRADALPDPVGGAPSLIGRGTESPETPPDASTPPPDGPRYRYTAWAGPGCPQGSGDSAAPGGSGGSGDSAGSTGEYRERGRFENGQAGWYTVGSGGFTGGSCDGRFSAVPMSGSPTEDRGGTAIWSWHLGKGFRECALTVFVPSSGRDRDVAGDPTFYRVLSDPDDTDSAYTGFAVRQPEHRGSPVDVRSFPVKGAVFAVQLIDRGRDWGDEELAGAHHAAAQLKVSCR
ncbi:adhesin [Streptomyces finlayi]|uniref:Adhesin n=2 Tax=Streptomyces finlayi TaxID=67296 RepID=A0A7G7BVI0_9ACTN|nr:adhesin [Streptomyces finlayi]